MCFNNYLLVLFTFLVVSNSEFIERGRKRLAKNGVETEINLNECKQKGHIYQTKNKKHQKYKTQQTYNGIEVFGATMVIEEEIQNKNNKRAMYGKYYKKDLIDQYISDIKPIITKYEALNISMNELNILSINDILSTNITNKITLQIYFNKHNDKLPYLSWILKYGYLDYLRIFSEVLMIINAKNGDILYSKTYKIESIPITVCGDGGNTRTGKQSYCDNTQSFANIDQDSLYLINDYVKVYIHDSSKSSNDMSNSQLLQCTEYNEIDNVCSLKQDEFNEGYGQAIDLLNFVKITFDLYDEWFDNNLPVKDEYIPLKSYINITNYGDLYANAYYWEGRIHFGSGNSRHFPQVTLDIVAHEIGHGFDDKGANLIYDSESGGMNEAYADLVGVSAKYFYKNIVEWAWDCDSEKDIDECYRYMNDPEKDGHSISHYSEYSESTNVHYSSGIYNKAMYILNNTFHWTIPEIFKTFSLADSIYWTTDSTFNEGLCGLYEAVYDLYYDGLDDSKVIGMLFGLENAFAAVGLFCDDANVDIDDLRMHFLFINPWNFNQQLDESKLIKNQQSTPITNVSIRSIQWILSILIILTLITNLVVVRYNRINHLKNMKHKKNFI